MKTQLNIIMHKSAQKFINKNFIMLFSFSVFLLIGVNSNSFAQQWQGSSTIDNSIYRNGSVGIGTTNPVRQLHVNEDNNAPAFLVTGGGLGKDIATFIRDVGGNGKISINSSHNDPQIKLDPEGGGTIWCVGINDFPSDHFQIGFGGSKLASCNIAIDIDDINGNVGIGTTDAQGYKLAVSGSVAIDGIIKAKELEIKLDVWSDFVFNDDYELTPLDQIEKYIKENKHLPDVPTDTEVTKEGLKVGEMNAILLQKIEELTLYLIEQNKQLTKLSEENEMLKARMELIEN